MSTIAQIPTHHKRSVLAHIGREEFDPPAKSTRAGISTAPHIFPTLPYKQVGEFSTSCQPPKVSPSMREKVFHVFASYILEKSFVPPLTFPIRKAPFLAASSPSPQKNWGRLTSPWRGAYRYIRMMHYCKDLHVPYVLEIGCQVLSCMVH